MTRRQNSPAKAKAHIIRRLPKDTKTGPTSRGTTILTPRRTSLEIARLGAAGANRAEPDWARCFESLLSLHHIDPPAPLPPCGLATASHPRRVWPLWSHSDDDERRYSSLGRTSPVIRA